MGFLDFLKRDKPAADEAVTPVDQADTTPAPTPEPVTPPVQTPPTPVLEPEPAPVPTAAPEETGTEPTSPVGGAL